MTNRSVNLRPVQAIVFGLAVLAVSLQWAALQMVAWVGMTLTNAQSMPLSQAMEKAISGRDACALCLFIAENRKNADGEETVLVRPVHSLEAVFGAQGSSLDVPPTSFCLLHESFIVHSGDMQMPTRPPPKTTV